MPYKAPQRPTAIAGETRNASVDWSSELDSGELLSTVTIAGGGLTITNPQVSTGALTILGASVATARAVQFTVSGGAAGATYTVVMTATTDSSPAQILVRALDVPWSS
jgi:hypothetical protein